MKPLVFPPGEVSCCRVREFRMDRGRVAIMLLDSSDRVAVKLLSLGVRISPIRNLLCRIQIIPALGPAIRKIGTERASGMHREDNPSMSEKIAFSSWNSRVAPVFDVAGRICLVETEAGRILSETVEILPAEEPVEKVRQLTRLSVNTLVCGAISRFLHDLVRSSGITVVPFVAGDLQEVIHAWMDDRLGDRFAMPGCCGRGYRRTMRSGATRCGGASYREGRNSRDPNDYEAGRPPGAGQRPSFSPEMRGMCVCPRCGHCEPHKRDVFCLHVQCPLCGGMMIRST